MTDNHKRLQLMHRSSEWWVSQLLKRDSDMEWHSPQADLILNRQDIKPNESSGNRP